jgi:hypothetical protein
MFKVWLSQRTTSVPLCANKKNGSSGMTQTSGVELLHVATQQRDEQGENTVSHMRGAAGAQRGLKSEG